MYLRECVGGSRYVLKKVTSESFVRPGSSELAGSDTVKEQQGSREVNGRSGHSEIHGSAEVTRVTRGHR